MCTHARTTSYHAWAERIQANHFSWLFRHLWLSSVLALACTLDCGCKGSSESAVQYSHWQLRFWSVCDLSICCVYSNVEVTNTEMTLMTRHAKRMRGDRSLIKQYWRPLVATSQLWNRHQARAFSNHSSAATDKESEGGKLHVKDTYAHRTTACIDTNTKRPWKSAECGQKQCFFNWRKWQLKQNTALNIKWNLKYKYITYTFFH